MAISLIKKCFELRNQILGSEYSELQKTIILLTRKEIEKNYKAANRILKSNIAKELSKRLGVVTHLFVEKL